MVSTVSRGNYYKKKTQKMYEDLGYATQLTEFNCGMQIGGGRIIYRKVDVFASDGISMNGDEIIFWNAKHATTKDSFRVVKSEGIKAFQEFPFPPNVKRVLVIWEPRVRTPVIIEVGDSKK